MAKRALHLQSYYFLFQSWNFSVLERSYPDFN